MFVRGGKIIPLSIGGSFVRLSGNRMNIQRFFIVLAQAFLPESSSSLRFFFAQDPWRGKVPGVLALEWIAALSIGKPDATPPRPLRPGVGIQTRIKGRV